MPLAAIDYFRPASQYVPYVLEDVYLKGGYRVFNTLADRDAYIVKAKQLAFFPDFDSRKEGMMCHVIENKTLYQLDSTKENWEELKTGVNFDIDQPLQFIGDTLRIDPAFILPSGGVAGSVLTKGVNGAPIWQTPGLQQGVRGTVEYTPANPIAPGAMHLMDFELPQTILLLKVELNTPDIKLEGWTTPDYTDSNPYTFISSEVYLTDEGIKDQNGELTKFRRFSVMANLQTPAQNRQYFSMTNQNAFSVQPSLLIHYLSLQ